MNIKKIFSKRRKKGFSLIEMVTVISILAVLALIIVPNITSYTKKAEFSRYINNASLIERSVGTFYSIKKDFPRLDDTPYTKAQIEAYSENIYNVTGEKVTLDPGGKYYDINYDEMSLYLDPPENEDKPKYILQNPVGKVFYLENLTESGENRADFDTPGSGSGEGSGTTSPEDGEETGGENPGDGEETGGENPGGEENPETPAHGFTKEQIDELVAQGYIKVSTVEDLINVKNNLTGKYIQVNDIDLSSNPWSPILGPFRGVYNGGNFKIENLNFTGVSEYGGLFSKISTNAHILNLDLSVNISSGQARLGAIAGLATIDTYGKPGAKIENINVTGTVSGSTYVGGIVGYGTTVIINNVHFDGTVRGGSNVGGHGGYLIYKSLISNSSFDGEVSGTDRVGGLAGVLSKGSSDKSDSTIENSSVTGSVKGTSIYVGGVAGSNNSSLITKSYTKVNIQGQNGAGGIVGELFYGTVKDSYARGTLYSTGQRLGGIVGYSNSGKVLTSYSASTRAGSVKTSGVYGQNSYGSYTNAFYDKTLDPSITSGDFTASQGKTSEQMKTQSTYVGWDFTNIWEMGPDGYPVLK